MDVNPLKDKLKKNDRGDQSKKETHLYLNDKYLTTINKLLGYDNLNVLYIHNNQLTKIDNLNHHKFLTSLYLQKNCISKLENLYALRNLKRLYIGNNEISVVEGLDQLTQLTEFHIEKQRLDKGESLCFNPKTIISISISLKVLNISHNNISTIAYLEPLRNLNIFNASNNNISNICDVIDTIKHWYFIDTIILKENPIAKQFRYRDEIIANTYRLNTLDGKVISENTRCFIKRFKNHNKIISTKSIAGINIASSFKDLPSNYAPPLQKAASLSILRKSFHDFTVNPTVQSQNLNQHIPWKAMPKSRTTRKASNRQNQNKSMNLMGTTFPQL